VSLNHLIRRLAFALLVLAAAAARAEHFDIDLTVEGPQDRQESHSDECPPFEGSLKRPLFHAKAGEPLSFQFLFTNVYPHGALKRAGVLYYIMPLKTGPLRYPPKSMAGAVLSGKFLLDFKSHGKLGLKQKFQIPEAGHYLLRAESYDSGAEHEHFSAIELMIE